MQGTVYDHSFKINETSVVKAKACKDTWYCSEVFEATCFVEGIKPNHVELLSPADPQYPGEGAQSLTDGRKGSTDVLKEASWLGYRLNDFSAGFDFDGELPTVKKIVLSYGKNIGAYSLPPEAVEVWGGNDKGKFNLIKKLRVEQPKGYESQKVKRCQSPFDLTYRFYK